MSKRELFNASTQQTEEAELTVDANNEVVATFENGHFIKFPAGLEKEEFEKLVVQHELDSSDQEIVTKEQEEANAAARANSLDLIGETETPAEDASEGGEPVAE